MSRFKHKKRKESKKSRVVVTLIIAVFMLTSIIGFMSNQNAQGDDITYGTFKLQPTTNGWIYKSKGQQVTFYNNPFEVDNIELSADAVRDIRNSQVAYLTFDPELGELQYVDLLRFELSEQMPMHFNTMIIPAVDRADTTYSLPVVDCNNATKNLPVIYLQKGKISKISYFSNCLVLEAPSSQLILRLKDRLMYGLFGIISDTNG